jgi:hypothetical protein
MVTAAQAQKAIEVGVAVGQNGYKGWKGFTRWWRGSVRITHPSNREVVVPDARGWLDLKGTHDNAKGIYWLVTAAKGDRYWPQCRIELEIDGRWSARVNLDTKPGPRVCNVLLAWTSTNYNAVLADYKYRSNKGKCWDPIVLPDIPRWHFSIVDGSRSRSIVHGTPRRPCPVNRYTRHHILHNKYI